MKRRRIMALLAIIGTLTLSLPADAFLTQVGDGDYLAHMVINFGNGSIYEFDVNFSDLAWTGQDLMNYIEQETTLITHQQEFDFGGGPVFLLDGLEFDGNSDIGFQGGNNWWQYWVRDDATDSWESSPVGFSDRTIADGSWDGWVYGNANPPVLIPEPGTLILFGVGMVALTAVRRRWSVA